jgi:hypothetical protein
MSKLPAENSQANKGDTNENSVCNPYWRRFANFQPVRVAKPFISNTQARARFPCRVEQHVVEDCPVRRIHGRRVINVAGTANDGQGPVVWRHSRQGRGTRRRQANFQLPFS